MCRKSMCHTTLAKCAIQCIDYFLITARIPGTSSYCVHSLLHCNYYYYYYMFIYLLCFIIFIYFYFFTFFLSLWKHGYSNILKILSSKNEIFQVKNSNIFHNYFCSIYVLSRNKKNNVYPCKHQFYYIKEGFKVVKIIYACYRDGNKNARMKDMKKAN